MQNKSKTVVIPVILILLCILTAVGTTWLQHKTADSPALHKVIATLEDHGYAVTVQKAEPFFLQGDRYQLILNEDESKWVTVYVYHNANAAWNDAQTVDPDGFGMSRAGVLGTMENIQVSWVAVPHFFLYENVIVQYIGNDPEILDPLRQWCGEQFAGVSLRITRHKNSE